MSDDLERIIVLWPKDLLSTEEVSRHHSKVITADCGHEAIIAPSSRRFLASDPDMRTVCGRCAPPDDEIDLLQAVPGSAEDFVREVAEHGLPPGLRG